MTKYLENSKAIWTKLGSDKKRYEKEITEISNAYNLLDMLRKFSNMATEEVMEEFFPTNGKHLWDNYVSRHNRNFLGWYNSLDSQKVGIGTREAFVIHLLAGDGLYATSLRGEF